MPFEAGNTLGAKSAPIIQDGSAKTHGVQTYV